MLVRWSVTIVVVSFVILLYLVTRGVLTHGHKGPPFRGHLSPCHGLSRMRGHLIKKNKNKKPEILEEFEISD